MNNTASKQLCNSQQAQPWKLPCLVPFTIEDADMQVRIPAIPALSRTFCAIRCQWRRSNHGSYVVLHLQDMKLRASVPRVARTPGRYWSLVTQHPVGGR